ncbi:hypothetical protein Skr01_56670 [Sphaerisporangium krabiense]|uniref:Uncharacterized protein n=1 Tax=Sphaerisporangium krabiense TaxID=763782 RepID=A0A7W8ZB45_9ACTN|nr:hypothetical protein [Sphaerisporangium krabiense]MBB5630737.1 hypothetical protein [Sphaerisporangium krabiense]GII65582.1 hypothetical protein Skr01_56670 [Sphaerisporangium krabiense]
MSDTRSDTTPSTTTSPRKAGWAGWAGYAAAVWAALYGVVALFWTISGKGYPFGPGHAEDSPALLRSPPASTGAPIFATVLLVTAVAALAMAGRHAVSPGRPARAALLGFGWTVAAVLLVGVPTEDVLALTGYAPMLILGAPFGWPRGVDYAAVFDWSLLNQVWCLAGGYLVAFTVLSWQRRARGACARCGRRHDGSARDRRRLLALSRWATAAAVVIPLLYAASRYAWLAGIPLGIDDALLRSLWDSGGVWAGAGLATAAVAGAALTLGLVQRWGEVFPHWTPGLAGRRVPITLAVIPAAYVAPIVVTAGLGIVTSPELGRLTGYSPVLLGTHALWLLWGPALAFAAFCYYLRRRGACPMCGRRG